METIIFDVDDTVYDQTLPFRNAFRKLFPEPFTNEEIEKIYIASRKHSDELFEKNVAGELSLIDMQIQRMTATCQEFDIAMTDEEAIEFQAVYLAEQQKITLFEEIELLLEKLSKQKKQLAVLTNGETDHQSMKIKQLNLRRWIPEENTFISASIGHAKPKQEAFHFIEDKLQLDKRKTVYIGDSFNNDIVGAKQVGWQAIWMNHRKRSAPETIYKPDKIVYSAKELSDYFS